jgi:anti-anti-sigma factor
MVAVTGEIDPTTAALFRTALEEAGTRAPRVVVDLSGVTFIDSTGISALIHAHQSVRPPGTLVLRSPSPTARRLLDLTGLDQIMSIEGDPDRDRCSTPPVEVRSDVVFDIGNQGRGRIIDVKVRPAVTAANWPTAGGTPSEADRGPTTE